VIKSKKPVSLARSERQHSKRSKSRDHCHHPERSEEYVGGILKLVLKEAWQAKNFEYVTPPKTRVMLTYEFAVHEIVLDFTTD